MGNVLRFLGSLGNGCRVRAGRRCPDPHRLRDLGVVEMRGRGLVYFIWFSVFGSQEGVAHLSRMKRPCSSQLGAIVRGLGILAVEKGGRLDWGGRGEAMVVWMSCGGFGRLYIIL